MIYLIILILLIPTTERGRDALWDLRERESGLTKPVDEKEKDDGD